MAKDLIRGSIWMYRFNKPDKLRPVLIISRQEVIGLIDTVIVAPITSTIYGIPSEVTVGIDQGLKQDCAVNLDHIQTISASRLIRYIGSLDEDLMTKVCFALKIATGCEG